MIKYISIFWLVFRCFFGSKKGEFDRFFNRLDRPVEESRPDRQPDRFPSLHGNAPAIGGSASPASLGVEMITHFDAETSLRCCQMK